MSRTTQSRPSRSRWQSRISALAASALVAAGLIPTSAAALEPDPVPTTVLSGVVLWEGQGLAGSVSVECPSGSAYGQVDAAGAFSLDVPDESGCTMDFDTSDGGYRRVDDAPVDPTTGNPIAFDVTYGSLRVLVLDAQGNPVQGASVGLNSDAYLYSTVDLAPGVTATARVTGKSARTDADGYATLRHPGIPTGDVTLTVEGAGLLPSSRPITITQLNDQTTIQGETAPPPVDSTAPSITINTPAEGATFEVGTEVVADYACTDEEGGSGIATCDGPVASGSPMDTSAAGSFTFTVDATDAAGNPASTTVHYTVSEQPLPDGARVTGVVRDAGGAPVPDAQVVARLSESTGVAASTTSRVDGTYALTLPAGTYDFQLVGPAGSGLGASRQGVAITEGDNVLDWELTATSIRLSGVVGDGVGGQLESAEVYALNAAGQVAATTFVYAPDTQFEFDLAPGSYRFTATLRTSNGDFSFDVAEQQFLTDSPVTLNPLLHTLQVNLVDTDNNPVAGTANLFCTYSGPEGTQSTHTTATGTGLTLWGASTTNWYDDCTLRIDPDQGINITQRLAPLTQDTELTYFTGDGTVVAGSPEDLADGDNVSPVIEAQVPSRDANGVPVGEIGDGNGDGSPDAQQPNVTSVPTFGSAEGADFVTIASPVGTELTNVLTLSPEEVPVAPPVDQTLPEGLSQFIVQGVEPGGDVTVSIYTESTAGITGYAKFNPNTQQWTTLPGDRVTIVNEHRVDIRLTDGGEGDADQEANGQVDDPGGLLVTADDAPPIVRITGVEQGARYRVDSVPVAGCLATDNLSLTGPCSGTFDRGDGFSVGEHTYTAAATDGAGNVGTASVTFSVVADDTAPTVAIGGLDGGQLVGGELQFPLGSEPTPTCTAEDEAGGSGLDGECVLTRTSGPESGVGMYVWSATATDTAGNAGTATATYRVVYRFDGFAQPINDPRLTSASRSVFKAGSTVPVKFQLKRADGSLVTPASAPAFVHAVVGTVAGTVNESTQSVAATTGEVFTYADGWWHYNWKTNKADIGTVEIGAELDDGTKRVVLIGLR